MNNTQQQALIQTIRDAIPHNGLWSVLAWDKDIRVAKHHAMHSDIKGGLPVWHQWFIKDAENWEQMFPVIAQHFESRMPRTEPTTLSQERQEEYLAFVANYVDHLHEAGIDRNQAEKLSIIAASCLLATVFHIQSKHDEIDVFCVTVIKVALKRFYGELD